MEPKQIGFTMTTWFKKHFTVGGVITLITALCTLFAVVGSVYVFRDDMGELQADFNTHTSDGHPQAVIKEVEKNVVALEGLSQSLEKKLDTSLFLAYQQSQKDLQDQFQKQLFQQLERIEGKIP